MTQLLASAIAPKHSYSQYIEQQRPDHECSLLRQTSGEVIISVEFNDSVLAGFRKEHREYATATAKETLVGGKSATETILQMATWVQEIRSHLNRKEFGTFVKGLLQWVGDEARKYLDIARVFEGFDLSQLVCLEPFTILKLRFKRYAPVVTALREQPVITPKIVQDLISELLPKRPRTKPDSITTGWKQCRSGGGRYYNVLLHDEAIGKSIEEQAEAEGILPIKVIKEAIALRSQHKSASIQPNEYVAAQPEEVQTVVEQAQSLDTENQKLMRQLQERNCRIAELEARLAQGASIIDAITKESKQVCDIDRNGSHVLVEQDDVQEQDDPDQVTRSCLLKQAQTWEDVAAAMGCDRQQFLKTVKNWTLEQRQALVKPLSVYLETEANALEHITWIPKNLLDKALSTLSFKVRILGGANNLADEPEIEYIDNCSFVSLEYPGIRSEQWIFRDSNNKLYPVFGRDKFEIEISRFG